MTSLAVVEVGGGAPGDDKDRKPEGRSDEEVIARFRAAFSHLESTDTYITAALLPPQAQALAAHRSHFGLAPKDPWRPEQLPDASEAERRQMEEFRRRLESSGALTQPEDAAYVTDLQLLRYLRARDHHLDKSYAMFLHTLQWRRTARPWALANPATAANKLSSDARIVGYDLQGRVVVYSCFAKSLERTPEHVKINTICLMEKANQCVNAGSPGSVVWVNHFCGKHKHGFGWRDASPAFAWGAIDIFSNHFPECLATMMIIDPPSIFFGLWKVVHPMLPEKTAKKGDFIHSDHDNRAKFTSIFGPELAAYILGLIAQDAR
ncbi:hypothetical protein HYH03_016990 [Edaphochlamys debaryana]|uniref:CRAL-TRIO domain-containing protein n=1 Tax=Edaphochlamys debaryana TaxID=47281 RepID=A0A835XJ88_9CHLO|nr:hypothetical protein HYH03_016990 [Edaphochlamys debaryana]KAG2484178.1 hypothetical protein HYH03_016990 [Edaphochlamys debaryana]|eukprot:KAG2484177.1 hypothetical protein HYH03_016990 [Edaphochlamys debaryana]